MALEVGRVRLAEGVRVLVACSSCGCVYGISPRTARGMKQAIRLPICHLCRVGRPIEVTDEMRDWWLARYSLADVVRIAEEMFGPRERW